MKSRRRFSLLAQGLPVTLRRSTRRGLTLKPVLVTGIQLGGQLTTTTDVENFPGFAQAVHGPELMEQMRQQAEHVGASIVFDTITSVDLSQDPILAQGYSGDVYFADTLIIATGAQANGSATPVKPSTLATASRLALYVMVSSTAVRRSS